MKEAAMDQAETSERSTVSVEIEGALRCLVCDTPVPGAVCGRKQPCPGCGFPYPLGDCSDLAEN